MSTGFFSEEKERFMFLFERSLTGRHIGLRTEGSTVRGAEGAKWVRYLCVLFLFAGLLVVGCQEPEDKNPSLSGTWVSEYGEKWIINQDNNTLDCPSEGYPAYAYKGTISEVEYFDNKNTTGIIFIQLTSKGASFTT
jgi:hypothetical protein